MEGVVLLGAVGAARLDAGGDGVEAPHLFAEAAQVLRCLRRRAEGQKGKDEHGKNLHGTQYSIMIRGNRA